MWNFVSFTGSSKDNGHVPENRIPERKLLDAEAAYMKIMVMCSHNRKEEGKKWWVKDILDVEQVL